MSEIDWYRQSRECILYLMSGDGEYLFSLMLLEQ